MRRLFPLIATATAGEKKKKKKKERPPQNLRHNAGIGLILARTTTPQPHQQMRMPSKIFFQPISRERRNRTTDSSTEQPSPPPPRQNIRIFTVATMAIDQEEFLHLARPVLPTGAGFSTITAPLSVSIQPQVWAITLPSSSFRDADLLTC